MWIVPAGQGKSRITHSTALFLLQTGAVHHVYMVFSSKRLMDRDIEEYAYFWKLAGLTDRVFYRVGLLFDRIDSSMLVIDESDSLLFRDPLQFKAMTTTSRCICLTATADDNNRKGAEKQAIKDAGLARFEYGYSAELTVPATINEVKAFGDNSTVLAFLQEKLAVTPVLFYCSEAMMAFLKDSEQQFICADDPVNDKALRKLGERFDESFSLIVATDPDAMRGVDYRADEITLLVGKSFGNARDGDQGLKRVGRNGDRCQRIAIEGIPLVDPVQEAAYQTQLLEFCRQMSTAKTICQPLPTLGGALKTTAQKKREKKEETKVPAAEKKSQKAIVDLSGKTTPANLFKKQVKVVADCLVQDQ
jgi:hypothetical protein